MTSTKNHTYFLVLLLAGVAVLSFFVFQPFLNTVALAAIFAVVLYPLYIWLLGKSNRKNISALLAILIGSVCALIPLTLVSTLVVNEARQAYDSLAVDGSGLVVTHVTEAVARNLTPYIPDAQKYADSISAELNTYATQGLQWLLQRVGAAFASILSLLLHLLIFFMTLFFFLKEGAKVVEALVQRSPIMNKDAQHVFTQLGRTVKSVVNGSLAIASIQGVLAGIGYAIFGVPSAALWGVTTALAALIPGVGTSLILIPAVAYLFVTGSTGAGIGLLLWGTLLVGLIDNFLAPRLMGRGAQLHPLVILLSVLGGIAFFGPVGIFLGPLTCSLLFALYTIYAGHTPATK